MTGGKALVEMLRRHEVDTIFALPGVQNDALFVAFYDAGERQRGHIRASKGRPIWRSATPGRAAKSAPMP
jgi:acetolactate synthase-1/2/3 large subunit